MSDQWPMCILPGGLAKPRPVIRTSYRGDVHIGGKGSRTTRLIQNDGSTIVSLYVFVYTLFLSTTFTLQVFVV